MHASGKHEVSGSASGSFSPRRSKKSSSLDPKPDEFCRKLGGAIGLSSRVADLQRDVLSFLIAKSLQTSSERVRKWARRCRTHQHADTRHFGDLLRCQFARLTEQGGAQRTDEDAPGNCHVRIEPN